MRRNVLRTVMLAGLCVAAYGSGAVFAEESTDKGLKPGTAGDYLASHFAQSRYDWKTAEAKLGKVLQADPRNADLLKRAMILAMGAGDVEPAARYAESLLSEEPGNNLALLILTVRALAAGNPEKSGSLLTRMPEGDIVDFVRPVLHGWTSVAKGKLDTAGLNATSIHSYGGALMALQMGDKKAVMSFIRKMEGTEGTDAFDTERIADLYAACDDKEKALSLYRGLLEQDKANRFLERKIAGLEKKDQDVSKIIPALQVKTPASGAAVAMYDMARILIQEQSLSSSQLFAQLAIVLDPQMTEPRLLLANALAQNGRYDEALGYFSSIGPDHELYMQIQHYMADLLEESGRKDEALARLESLFRDHDDVEALIRIGDIHRRGENYGGALQAYNRAADRLGSEIPEQFWHLLYARGMVYEREGMWAKAESDLKAALVYRPDHPYILNYLGYSWADQGVNLDESLKLIQRAAELRPDDGFITDSLGWVLFMTGRYDEAVPKLEKAVELMPYDATLNDHLGDAYWVTGRRTEALYQWRRALNYAGADVDKDVIGKKLAGGFVPPTPIVREARTATEHGNTP